MLHTKVYKEKKHVNEFNRMTHRRTIFTVIKMKIIMQYEWTPFLTNFNLIVSAFVNSFAP